MTTTVSPSQGRATTQKLFRSLRRQRLLQKSVANVVLAVGGIVMLLPFFWMLSSSLKRPETIYVFPPQWIPKPAYWRNYVEVFRVVPVLAYAKNTLVIAFAATAGGVITSALAGYGFGRLRFPGRDLMFGAILSTMMLPFAVTMIPVYIMFSRLKWVGTFLPLIVPAWFGGGGLNIFLFRQFFRTIPMELEEAALIDGASRGRIFAQIILPLARPAIAVVAILSFLGHWNDFMGPLIYLQDRRRWTLALGVNGLRAFESGLDWTHYMLVLSTMMVVPIIVVYFIAQRAFVQGIVLTGIKG
jgi:multiple sugar transport system permease protein